MFDWLSEIRLEDLPDNISEFQRGIYEGMRRLAKQIQDYVMIENQKPSEE